MKVTLALLVLSLGLAVAFLVHAIATGVVIPYPDPTPEQAAYERFHRPIGSALFLAAGASFAAYLASAVVAVGLKMIGRQRRS